MAKNKYWQAGAAAADSKFEGQVRDTVLQDWEFQGKKIPYTVEHTYTPDFVKGNYVAEVKGRFRDSAEARKYLYIRETLEKEGRELVFIFMNKETFFPFAKKRKDGTKMKQTEWADKHNFKWFTIETVLPWLNDTFETGE